jgi:1-deoxyxylulose-5-phosphate synthase
MAQVGLAWVMHNPTVSAPLIGATRPQHLSDAVAALTIQLSDEECHRLTQAYVPRYPTFF